MAACDTTNKFNLSNLCVTTCRNESSPFLAADGVNCASTCSFGYSLAGPETQCISTCTWPSAFYVNSSYSLTVKMCSSSCPSGTFLNREDQNCVSSCSYVNATQIGGNTVCEVVNGTHCPY